MRPEALTSLLARIMASDAAHGAPPADSPPPLSECSSTTAPSYPDNASQHAPGSDVEQDPKAIKNRKRKERRKELAAGDLVKRYTDDVGKFLSACSGSEPETLPGEARTGSAPDYPDGGLSLDTSGPGAETADEAGCSGQQGFATEEAPGFDWIAQLDQKVDILGLESIGLKWRGSPDLLYAILSPKNGRLVISMTLRRSLRGPGCEAVPQRGLHVERLPFGRLTAENPFTGAPFKLTAQLQGEHTCVVVPDEAFIAGLESTAQHTYGTSCYPASAVSPQLWS